jgi:hypothetical protein
VLPVGQTVEDGPFTCVSVSNGVTCTIASGNGFTMTTTRVSQIGG